MIWARQEERLVPVPDWLGRTCQLTVVMVMVIGRERLRNGLQATPTPLWALLEPTTLRHSRFRKDDGVEI